MRVFYDDRYVRARHEFDTLKKAGAIARSLRERPIPGVEIAPSVPVTEEELLLVHDPEYVAAVRTGHPRELAESQGFPWDPGIWEVVTASTGGVLLAAKAALQDGVSGSLSSGLHHASARSGMGFCTFNGLVLAAKMGRRWGLGHVLILDLDAHCGGGTHSLVSRDSGIKQLDVSVNHLDSYEPSGGSTLDIVADSRDYLPTIERRLAEFSRAGEGIDLCIYNAGMDPFDACGPGGLGGIDRDTLALRERLVFGWCRANVVPVAFVLAGGYTRHGLSEVDLVDLHRLTIEAAAR